MTITFSRQGLVEYILSNYRIFDGRLIDIRNHITEAQSSNIVLYKLLKLQTRWVYRATLNDGTLIMITVRRNGDLFSIREVKQNDLCKD